MLTVLQQRLAQVRVFLLVIMDMQEDVGLLHVENTSSHLLFYRIHEDLWLSKSSDHIEQRHRLADAYSVGIAAALQYWAQEEQVPLQIAAEPESGIVAALKS